MWGLICWLCDPSVRLHDGLRCSAWHGCVQTSHSMSEAWIPGSVELVLFCCCCCFPFFLSPCVWANLMFSTYSYRVAVKSTADGKITLTPYDCTTFRFSHFCLFIKNSKTHHLFISKRWDGLSTSEALQSVYRDKRNICLKKIKLLRDLPSQKLLHWINTDWVTATKRSVSNLRFWHAAWLA